MPRDTRTPDEKIRSEWEAESLRDAALRAPRYDIIFDDEEGAYYLTCGHRLHPVPYPSKRDAALAADAAHLKLTARI